MSLSNTRADSQCYSQQKPPHSFLFPSENPPYRTDSKDSGSQMEDWCETTPRPVSWWAVKGLERAKQPGSRPARFCLCWQPCFSGNSLGTGDGESLQELELSRGLAVPSENSWGDWFLSRQTVDCLLSGDPKILYQPSAAPSLSVHCSSSLPRFLFGGKVRVSWGGRNQPGLQGWVGSDGPGWTWHGLL